MRETRHHAPARIGRLLAGVLAIAAPASAVGIEARDDLPAAERDRVLKVTRPTGDFSKAEPYETLPAGAATSLRRADENAFSHFTPTLPLMDEERFKLGNALFRKVWVEAPGSTRTSDGLGPLYNARACQRCHRKDGRGRPPEPSERAESLVLRLSVRPRTETERTALAEKRRASIPDPVCGEQLQNFAISGQRAEGEPVIRYESVAVTLDDGETVHLRKPAYTVEADYQDCVRDGTMLSPRIANPMVGLGLLEAVHVADILAREDPEDADGDGISGRANRVRDRQTGALAVGRFGWKAGSPSIRQQVANAFAVDVGISTTLFADHWGDCTERQPACREAPGGSENPGDAEASDAVLDLVAFYSRNLAVPARRNVDDPDVLAGKALFYAAGCSGCHTPKYVTRRDAEQAEHAFQLIWPYTDMLLHDMGEGLADGRPEWDASGREWRTPPLWGIGLTEAVSGHASFLHDGRARTLLEAILWHGGEAAPARDRVAAMSARERDALVAFLQSL